MKIKNLNHIAFSLLFLLGSQIANSQCSATLTGGGAICADGTITLPIVFDGDGPWTINYELNGTTDPTPITTSDNPFLLIVDEIGTYSIVSAESASCGMGEVLGSAEVNDNPSLDGGVILSHHCDGEPTELSATVVDGTPPYEYLWSNGFTGEEQLVFDLEYYQLTITDAAGCTVVGGANAYDTTCVIIQTGEMICEGTEVMLTAQCNDPNLPLLAYLWSNGETTESIVVTEPGLYEVTISAFFTCEYVRSIDIPFPTGCGTIQGSVINDLNLDCLPDGGDLNLQNWIVRATGNEDFFGITDSSGNYIIHVVPDVYEVETVPPNTDYWNACQSSFLTTIEDFDDIDTVDFLEQQIIDCPYMIVDVGTWAFRRCFETPGTVVYCNMGTAAAEDARIEITVDPLLEILSASVPFTGPVGNTYTFEIGDVGVGECSSFAYQIFTSCDGLLGEAVCMEAKIFPDTLCAPIDPSWSEASLELNSECDGDSLYFTISNIGAGAMNGPLEFVVIEDGVMMLHVEDGPALGVGVTYIIAVPANGSTYILEVPQVEGHPGESAPLLAIEGCGSNNSGGYSTGFFLQYPQDDRDDFISIFCLEITGSYDPNDKQGFPIGYGEERFIELGQDLEYFIRFQNTGTDTAFTVRIEDVISDKLDLSTFRPGTASHPYEVSFFSDTVVFLFPDILLPDSNVNEPLSHGFIKFNIQQMSSNELGDVIENNADIYFDFNDPVRTNTTLHLLGEEFIASSGTEVIEDNIQIFAYPNPTSGETTLYISGDIPKGDLNLQLFDLTGRLVKSQQMDLLSDKIITSDLATGLYLYNLNVQGKRLGQGKLAVE